MPLNDPDSLKAAPNGDLLLTSGSDGTIVDVHHAGKSDQSISFTQITDDKGSPATGLDDVIKTNATSGTFYLTDTKNNSVEAFHVSGLSRNDYYASVDSLGGFGRVDPTTGHFTLLVAASGAHGIAFTSDASRLPTEQPDNFDTSLLDTAFAGFGNSQNSSLGAMMNSLAFAGDSNPLLPSSSAIASDNSWQPSKSHFGLPL